jgi:hypothetical protein
VAFVSPSPHIEAEQSTLQVADSPSLSHVSPAVTFTVPSPHAAAVQSTSHEALSSPSSHVSSPSTIPSPHTAGPPELLLSELLSELLLSELLSELLLSELLSELLLSELLLSELLPLELLLLLLLLLELLLSAESSVVGPRPLVLPLDDSVSDALTTSDPEPWQARALEDSRRPRDRGRRRMHGTVPGCPEVA